MVYEEQSGEECHVPVVEPAEAKHDHRQSHEDDGSFTE